MPEAESDGPAARTITYCSTPATTKPGMTAESFLQYARVETAAMLMAVVVGTSPSMLGCTVT